MIIHSIEFDVNFGELWSRLHSLDHIGDGSEFAAQLACQVVVYSVQLVHVFGQEILDHTQEQEFVGVIGGIRRLGEELDERVDGVDESGLILEPLFVFLLVECVLGLEKLVEWDVEFAEKRACPLGVKAS